MGFIGTVINQFLKLWFRIPRPWVKDPAFTIVESARAEATGYSFPSGHTQSSVGVFGSIGRITTHKWLRFLCIAACILVPFSRMYLGVHTPADVLVSVAVALLLIFGLYPIIDKAYDNRKSMRLVFIAMTGLALLYFLFVHFFTFPADVDPHNLASGFKNAYKILACIIAMWLAFEVDTSCTHFDTNAVWWAQILKLVVGLLPVLAIKSGLKEPLNMLIGNTYIADGIRYFLLTAFAGCIWPMTFKWWGKLGR